MLAIYTGKLACVQELLQAGALTDAVDRNGCNMLHHACYKDQDDVVRFLAEICSMSVNAASENKGTPLHKAGESPGTKACSLVSPDTSVS